MMSRSFDFNPDPLPLTPLTYKTIIVYSANGAVDLITKVTEVRLTYGLYEAWDRYGRLYQWHANRVLNFSVTSARDWPAKEAA